MRTTDLLNDHRKHSSLPDKNNQILWWKAMRDRFGVQHSYRSYLCSPRSEDALTWTIFRTLEQEGSLGNLAKYFGIETSAELDVLYWMFHAEKPHSQGQAALWELLRDVDGKVGGQTTEPDIVLIGERELCFVEAKLGEPGKKPTLWANRKAKRVPLYKSHLAHSGVDLFHRELSEGEEREFYQLIRNVFYAWALAARLRPERKPIVACLVNERNLTAPRRSIQQAFDDFRSLLREDTISPFPRSQLSLKTWQGLAEVLERGDAHERKVAELIWSHPCLSDRSGGAHERPRS